MTTTTGTTVTTHMQRVYIKATPEAVWEAITDPEWNAKYGYHARSEYDLRPGGIYRSLANAEMLAHGSPEVAIEGEVVEANPPHKLVQTWHAPGQVGAVHCAHIQGLNAPRRFRPASLGGSLGGRPVSVAGSS